MDKIFKYKNEAVLNRYCKDNDISIKTGEEHFKALLKFLKTCSSTNLPCYPSQLIDEVWHTFILFTKDYYTFCNDYLGKFIHHNPMDTSDEIEKGYYCYINPQTMKWQKKLVKNRKGIIDCGSGGNCSSCGSGGNCSSCKD